MNFKNIISTGLAIVLTLSTVTVPTFAQNSIIAFPGAYGGGMYSLGARASNDIELYHVTNLNDSGAGSLRNAVSQGNRIIVFDVSGNIKLQSILKIYASNITILGQTAPGEGICISGESVEFDGSSNIILRYLRFRSGDTALSQEDGLGFRRCNDVIVDHCSISWSVDECLSAYENKNFTAQYCIISESLNRSIHSKGEHGYGGIWGGINASFHHNLISTHNSRNPRIGSSATVHSYEGKPDYENLIDIRNNVFYNWKSNSGYGGENNTRVNLVNNYYKPSNLSKVKRFYEIYSGTDNAGTTLYVDGNVMEGSATVTANNWNGVVLSSYNPDANWTKCDSISDGYTDTTGTLWSNDQYLKDYAVLTTDANTAYNVVLENAGANIYRDSIDQRVIADVKNGTYPTGSNSGNGLIDSQEDVGGWIPLYGKKLLDSDNDGISDEWELANGLDINKADSILIANNRYTNLENYANYLATTNYEGYDVDTSQLKIQIDLAKSLDKNAYILEEWSNLQNKVAVAEQIYNSSSPTSEQVNNICAELEFLLANISKDYTETLQATIQKAENIDLLPYTADTVFTLTTVIEKAKADLKNNARDSYKADIDAIEAAISSLLPGAKATLRSKIDYINAMNLSHLIISNRNIINSKLDEADKVYKDVTATDLEVAAAIKNVNEIVINGNYTRRNNGKIIEIADFEDENPCKEGYQCNKDGVTLSVVDGYGSNSTKVLTSTRDTTSNISYLKYAPLKDYSHYMISVDMVASNKNLRFISLQGMFLESTPNTYFSPTNYRCSGQTYSYDIAVDDFIDLSDWTNLAIEVNKDTSEMIYYVNNIPISHVTSNISICKYYGFGIPKMGSTAYFDNLKLIDLSDETTLNVLGDADDDGILTTNDSAVLLQKILNPQFSTDLEARIGPSAIKYLDMNCDKELDSVDCAYILQKSLNSSFSTPADIENTTSKPIIETTTEFTTSFVLDLADIADGEYNMVIGINDNFNAYSTYNFNPIVIGSKNGEKYIQLYNSPVGEQLPRLDFKQNVYSDIAFDIEADVVDSAKLDVYVQNRYKETIDITAGRKHYSLNISPLYSYTCSFVNTSDSAIKIYSITATKGKYIEPTTQIPTEPSEIITSELTTISEIITETSTEISTLKPDYSFNFDDIEVGEHSTDFSNSIFSIVAENSGYVIDSEGDTEKCIVYMSSDGTPYISINLPDGSFGISMYVDIAGNSYSLLEFIKELDNSTVAKEYIYSGKTNINIDVSEGGKYKLLAIEGIELKVYSINVYKKDTSSSFV